MADERGGTKFAQLITEIDLDRSKYDKKLDETVAAANTATLKIEKAFSGLGIRTDESYQKQKAAITTFYKKITEDATLSANERANAEAMLARKIEQINAKQYSGLASMRAAEKKAIEDLQTVQNTHWSNLNTRSNASIELQKKQVLDSYAYLKSQAQGNATELARIEAAKNVKLKSLNDEMVGAHDFSIAAMQRAILRLYATYYIFSQVAQAVVAPLKAGIDYLAKIETATLGIASSYMTGGKYIDVTTGKALEGSAALKAAQVDAKSMIKELEFANLQTIATLDQLIVAYQQTLPVAISKGFDRKQVKDFTLAMVQAAGAIGLPMDQMGEETRSLLTASINPRTSRIATVLGLRNEDIRQYENNATALFDFLMQKLDAYRIAGIKAQETWAGLWSNTKDIINQALGSISQPIFDRLKSDIMSITGSMYSLNEETKKIEWRPEFIATIESIKTSLAEAYDWTKKFALAVTTIVGPIIPYTGTIIEMITTGLFVKFISGAILGVESFAVALAGAKTAMEGLALASKSFLPILAGFAAYKGAQWVDGLINGVDAADLKLSDFTKNQQKILAEAEAKKTLYRQNEQKESDKLVKMREDANKEMAKLLEKDFREMVRVLTEFEKEHAKLTLTTEQAEIQSLNVRLDAYRRYGADELRLEELKQAGLRDIMIRANNEQLQLLEELWKATANTKYRDAAIELMKQIKDAEQEKWKSILKNDDDALLLRTKREQEYHDRLEGMIAKTVQVEQAATEQRSHIIRQFYDEVEAAKPSEMATGATLFGGISGMPLINDSKYQPFYDLVSGRTQKAQEDNLARIKAGATMAADAAQRIATENKRIADEYQREYEARVNTFKSLKGQFDSYIQGRERASWGQAEYQTEFARLAASFGQTNVFEEQIELLSAMLDTIKELESIEQQILDEQVALAKSLRDSSKSISDWLAELSIGESAPAQNAAIWDARYEALRQGAMADQAKLGDFLSFAQQYLSFQKTYGTAGSYQSAYGSVVSSVRELDEMYNIYANLADLGLGSTLTDLQQVKNAFLELGVPIETLRSVAAAAAGTLTSAAGATGGLGSAADVLKNAASTASGAEGMQKIIDALGITLPGASTTASGGTDALASVLMGTETPFSNVIGALNSMASGVQSKIQEVSGFFESLATSLGLTFTGEAVGTAVTNLTPTTYAPPSIASAWSTVPGSVNTKWNYIATGKEYWLPTNSSYTPTYAESEWWIPGGWSNQDIAAGPYTWKGISTGRYFPTPGGLADGGLTSGLTFAGEIGPEWVVPTYEPQKSSFLKTVGADPETLGKTIARYIQSSDGGSANGESTIHNHIYIDGKEIQYVVTKGMRTNPDLIESTRRAVN